MSRPLGGRRMALGLAGYGVQPLILGNLKPDNRDLVEALGGQVIELANGRGNLNVLAPCDALATAARLTGQARTWLTRALEILADRHDGVPVFADLPQVAHGTPSDIARSLSIAATSTSTATSPKSPP
ncbi:hypothetical protein [Kribbella sp. HUAS MG21]|uniref:Uncharacterized protein n=1 Tax=Kribbella sp. HUAS MG21 TaxID=3160966 RepID=A0AAU7T645_9ACTN